jgi:hypothetical protein
VSYLRDTLLHREYKLSAVLVNISPGQGLAAPKMKKMGMRSSRMEVCIGRLGNEANFWLERLRWFQEAESLPL